MIKLLKTSEEARTIKLIDTENGETFVLGFTEEDWKKTEAEKIEIATAIFRPEE